MSWTVFGMLAAVYALCVDSIVDSCLMSIIEKHPEYVSVRHAFIWLAVQWCLLGQCMWLLAVCTAEGVRCALVVLLQTISYRRMHQQPPMFVCLQGIKRANSTGDGTAAAGAAAPGGSGKPAAKRKATIAPCSSVIPGMDMDALEQLVNTPAARSLGAKSENAATVPSTVVSSWF